jgi:PAS domain S-box-containing protein
MLQIANSRPLAVVGAKGDSGLPLEAIEVFFDQFPGACFLSKDAALRYVSANAATVQLCGVRDRREVIGRSARDFFAEPTSERYERAERRAMRTGRSSTNRLDRCVRLRGRPAWLLLRHLPFLQGGRAAGVVTIARNLDASEHRQALYERLAAALDYLHADFGAAFSYGEFAARAGVSLSQLQRDFVQVLGLTPRAYLTCIRFETAIDMLAEKRPVVEVAHACGYADQSAFTRRFRCAIGTSPMQYSRSYALNADLIKRGFAAD